MMDRLTIKWSGLFELKGALKESCQDICDENVCEKCVIQKAFNKLGEYEDLEEQGLLLRLPVPIGTKVYSTDYECEGEPYDCDHCCDSCACNVFDVYVGSFDTWMLDDIGKTVFLTRVEAEKALEKMKGE